MRCSWGQEDRRDKTERAEVARAAPRSKGTKSRYEGRRLRQPEADDWTRRGEPQMHATLTSKANATKRNVIASVSDDAVMRTIHHLLDICLQFQ